MYILKNNKWINAEPEDIRDISPFINDKYKLQTNNEKLLPGIELNLSN